MFIAGYNQSGYLPTSTPEQFESFDEAKRFVIGELLLLADQYGDACSEDYAEQLTHIAEDVNLESAPFCTPVVAGYVWWVEQYK